MVKNTKDPNVQIYLKNQGLENVNLSEYVDLQKRIMQAKLAIKDNNKKYADNISLRNQKNGKLFKELKEDYEQLKNINSKIDLNQTQIRLNQASSSRNVSSQKKKEAATFKAKKMIQKVDKNRLSVNTYKVSASNIMKVLDDTEKLIRKS